MPKHATRNPSLNRRLSLLAALLALTAPITQAQTSAAPATPPVYDVATIRPNDALDSHFHVYSSPHDGHFRAVNVTLKTLLNNAFAMPDTRIIGGPSWLSSDKFDLEAKADSSVDDQLKDLTSEEGRLQKRQMLQLLLADRFKLAVHLETRELPVYALVVAKGGPKLPVSKENGNNESVTNGHMILSSANSVALLAEKLSLKLGRDVLDQTGINGRYKINLTWTPDVTAAPNASQLASSTRDVSGPSIFTAIQEQLGLKLISTKSPVQVLVIDHIERPSSN